MPRSAPLRVFHLTTAADVLAGAEQLLVGIARNAKRDAWQLGFGTLLPRGLLHDELAAYGWPVHSLDVGSAASLPFALRRLRHVLRRFEPDVLHVHLFHATVLAAAARALDPRLVVVQTRHYSDFMTRFRRRRAPVDAWAARRCRHIIAVSDAARSQLVDVERVPASRVTVVDNGVDWGLLSGLDHERGRRTLEAAGVPSASYLVGCAARFDAQKGHVYLLDAFARVLEQHQESRLVLLGDGPLRSAMSARATDLGIAPRVHFLGHRSDAHQLMAGLDVYVQPSLEEGFGLAVIEAMAMRRAVVASAVGGMLQTVTHDETGLRAAPGDVGALARALLTLATDRALAARLGESASAVVRARYSLALMLERYDDVYRTALGSG